jgi:hypothetical protein
MVKLYEIELDRNERDLGSFIKSRNISLSRKELKVLIASKSKSDGVSLFDTENFLAKLLPNRILNSKKVKNSKTLKPVFQLKDT